MLRSMLSFPRVYSAFQYSLARYSRGDIAKEYIRAYTGCRVLDIGCGPAEYLPYLVNVDYTGIDISQPYIEAAKAKHPRARFVCASFMDCAEELLGPFDVILAAGFVHHIPDDAAVSLAAFAASRLSPTGRLVTIDPAIYDGQHPVAHFLAKMDRGRYVRTPQAIVALLARHLCVTMQMRHDLLRVPYTHVITECNRASS